MRAVDTNVLVRLIARDDSRQVESAESFIENGAWVSVLALAEATWCLSVFVESSAKNCRGRAISDGPYRDNYSIPIEYTPAQFNAFYPQYSGRRFSLIPAGLAPEHRR